VTNDESHDKADLRTLILGTIGIVFGDIGTSPLYALKETMAGHHPIEVAEATVLGVLSLIFWAVMFLVSAKYVALIMRADNRGEGGILALMALVGQSDLTGKGRRTLLLLGLFGAALLYGDGMITPAISVLSAVEGLGVQPFADIAAGHTEPHPVLERLLPISLNLRYRGGGRVGLVASAGVSYLPGLDFAVTQELGIGAVGGVGGIDLPTLPLEAGGEIAGFWGANAGLGLRVRLSDAVSASVEGRAFFFGERELEWTIERFPISPDLGELLRQQLDPIRFTPGFFQATAGLSVRF